MEIKITSNGNIKINSKVTQRLLFHQIFYTKEEQKKTKKPHQYPDASLVVFLV